MGILDYATQAPEMIDPRTQGLLAAGFAGLQAAGPSRMPVSLGQVIGQGGQAGMGAYMGAQKQLMDETYRRAQMQRMDEDLKLKRQQLDAEINKPQSVGPGSILTDRTGKIILENPHARGAGQGTQTERSFTELVNLQKKADAGGGELSPEDDMRAQTLRAILSQQRIFTDTTTGQTQTFNPITIPPHLTVGVPRAGPGRSLAPQPMGPQLPMGQPGMPPQGPVAAPPGPMQAPGAPMQAPGPQAPGAPIQPGQVLPVHPNAGALAPGPNVRMATLPPDIAVPNTGGRKPLDQASEKELQGFADANRTMGRIFGEFQPSYGGFVLDPVADFAIKAGRRLSPEVLKKFKQEGLDDQAGWWQDYYQWANDIRAAKFGLTLTGNELTAFERSTPKPSDGPEQIQTALEKQMQIIAGKQRNRLEGLQGGGYNMQQAKATAGPIRLAAPAESAGNLADTASQRGEQFVVHESIPSNVFKMPKTKEFTLDGGKKTLGALRSDGKYYVKQNGTLFRLEE